MPAAPSPTLAAIHVNDVHSRLNATPIARVLHPADRDDAQRLVRDAFGQRMPLAVMGARHAMGGQQFLRDGAVLDTGRLARVLAFDVHRGRITVEAGMRWPQLLDWLTRSPANAVGWTIRQKQTGADDFSLGGAVASNIHGRGLAFAPFAEDVEALEVLDARGERLHANRSENSRLFAHVLGGYGMFGIVLSLTLRLVPRCTVRRDVALARADNVIPLLEAARDAGAQYGDFQFAIDPSSPDFLDLGIVSCYHPAPGVEPDPAPRHLGQHDFAGLLALAHHAPGEAFARYADFYLASHGQHYASDAQQMGVYLGDYHAAIDRNLGHCGSEMIGEFYVPRAGLPRFLAEAADTLRRHRAQPIYGTVRLIERDVDTALPWARAPWACIVLNLHVRHDAQGLHAARAAFRALIDVALAQGGSFYLTYHRWATRGQLEAAYPSLADWIDEKYARDPHALFRSDWWNALAAMFGHTHDA